MADERDYNERIAGKSPHKIGFQRQGGGRATLPMIIGNKGDGVGAITSVTELHDAIREILGFTTTHPNGEGLARKLPKCHPMFPQLYANAIQEMVGLGRPTMTDAAPGTMETDTFDSFALYPAYELMVEFSPRMYTLCGDDDITQNQTFSINWTDTDGVTVAYEYAKEWLRYTDSERVPAGTWITAESGQFLFDVSGGAIPNGVSAGAGQIRMFMPEEGLKVTWYEVPYDFVDTGSTSISSYISQGLGCVNQHDWNGYTAGTLLLHGIALTRYVPPMPEYASDPENKAIVRAKKLCDITFIMTFKEPDLTANPSAAANAQTVQYGHNLMPYAWTGGWYYAKTNVPAAASQDGKPLFPSFPYQLLFTNPGV